MPHPRVSASGALGLCSAVGLLAATAGSTAFRGVVADVHTVGGRESGKAHAVAPFLPVGIYLGSPEEGARVLTAVRLYPEGHPDALGHEYPTAFGLHRSEVELLIRMGRLVRLELYATLMRHPAPPAEEWEYGGFSPPPPAILDAEAVEAGPRPIPGLRVVAYLDGEPLAYLVDTRGMSLEERGMERGTSSGLDIPRTTFVAALETAGQGFPTGAWLAVFER